MGRGTWIAAALYYSNNLNGSREVVIKLGSNDAISVVNLKKALEDSSLTHDLAFINAHFSKLPEIITALEKRQQPPVHAIKLFTSYKY